MNWLHSDCEWMAESEAKKGLHWRITVGRTGLFHLKHTDHGLTNRAEGFETFNAAKAYCESSENAFLVFADEQIPAGYAETLDCLNKPESWETRGMIVDMAEYLRTGREVPAGQLLAALDWMTFRLEEARDVLVADSKSEDAETLLRKLRSW